MSDSTIRRDAAHEPAISDEPPVDRRRFLAKLGSMSAFGAAFLGLGDVGAGIARGLAARGAARPIYMLSLGDSIMWGQGLAEPQKFRNIVQQHIRANNPERRDVVQLNYAHSGASLGYFPFGAYGQSSRFLAARRAHARARIDPSGTLDIDSPMGDEWPDDSTGGKIDREIASTSDRRPHPDSTPEEKFGGEIPRANPILWRQMDMTMADLATRKIDPADIDLVLMDGGANDLDFVDTMLNADLTPNWLEFQAREMVKQRMGGFLPWALKTFPNAKFVVTGYYSGVSPMSSPAGLTPLVVGLAAIYAQLGIVFPIPALVGGVLAASYINDTIGRSAAFEKGTSDGLRAAIAGSGGRAVFVSPDFQPAHAYGAPQTLMFRIEERDPVATGRESECHTIYAPKSSAGSSGAGASPLSPEGFCRKAATFHPNPAGARRYADRIIAALPGIMPLMNTASRSMRLTVQGTTAALTKTVTVTAVDASSGQPLNGTVAINGVTGRTGAPVTFRTCTEAVATEAAAGDARPVRRPVVQRGGAAIACTGTVSVPGYPATSFEY